MTRSRGVPRLLAVLLVVGPAGVATARPLDAQAADWTVGRDAFAELWYHTLARVTPAADGPTSLYSADYVRGADSARRARAIVSRLDAAQPALRAAMRAEPGLEVLHFVPMYFIGDSPAAVLRALRAALASPRRPGDDALARRAALVARALANSRERALAGQLVDAASDEWQAMQRGGSLPPGPDPVAMSRLHGRWLTAFEPALRPYLAGAGIRRGRIVVVPSVGLDGRVVQTADGAALVVVGTEGSSVLEDAPLLLAVRELAYPLVQRLPAHLLATGPGARGDAERARGAAAVRAGALLLAAHVPAVAPAYRTLFAGAAAQGDPRAFEQLYATGAELDAALQSAVTRLGRPRSQAP